MRSLSPICLFAVAASIAALPAAAADLNSEIANAATHAGLATQASDIAGVHTHLHHTINCLVGPDGTGFDAKETNPCANSGSGAIPDAANASTKQTLQAALEKANSGLESTDFAVARKDASAAAALLKGVK
jgi:hypothetical protein